MGKAFKQFKRSRKAAFERWRGKMGFNLGVQRQTRLKRSLGRVCTTLLNPDVAEEYAFMLRDEMVKHWGRGWRTKPEEQARLRFLTVLDSVVPLEVEDVVKAGRKLARRIQAALEGQRVWCLGAVEIELINRARLRQAAHGKNANARRKHTVVESLVEPLYRADDGTFALVHFHGLVDLGHGAYKNGRHEAVTTHLKNLWSGNFLVHTEKTYSTQTIGKNFDAIARYMTKGGNEDLRYKDKFGREQLENKIWRQGTGRADSGGETVDDERGLTLGEIRDLDAIYRKLMGKDGDGFVVRVAVQGKKGGKSLRRRR